MIRLCTLSELDDPGSRGFNLQGGHFFVVRKGDKAFAYRNSCPHLGVPLEWTPDQFLDTELGLIQCATHGALFTLDSGTCVHGPCLGRDLLPVTITVKDDVIWLVE